MRKPDLGSLIKRGGSDTGCLGVSTIECPCTLHTNLIPARKCKRMRTCLGNTTWPALDSFAVMSYRLTLGRSLVVLFLGTSDGIRSGQTPDLSGTGADGLRIQTDAPSRVHSRPLVTQQIPTTPILVSSVLPTRLPPATTPGELDCRGSSGAQPVVG